jgi:adenosylmethionine-8-amino-7-oxononanoate aminotransferase
VTRGREDGERLRKSALDYLWMPLREPSELAERGEPTIIVQGKGVKVTDISGREYLDAMSGLWLVNAGYGRKEIADAAYEQLVQLHYHPSSTTTVPTVKLAEKLAQLTPGGNNRSFFVSGGSEAVETAVKIARAYQKRRGEAGRYKIITRKGSYHGALGLTTWLGGSPVFPRSDFEPSYPGIIYEPQPLPYRCEFGGKTPSECAVLCAKHIEETILFHGPETVAALIAEPVAVPMGAAVPGPEYWPMLREICDKHGVVLIVDEVICGFGRTGKWFGIQNWGVVPDIVTVAKALTSGYYPMGAAIVKKEIADAFVGNEKLMLRHLLTFGGHPAASAAALKNLEILEREKLADNAAAMGKYMLDQLTELKDKHPMVGDVRGVGLLCALEFVKDRATKERWPQEADLRHRVTDAFTQNGVICRGGDVVNFAPPLCITRSEVDDLVAVTNRVIGQVEKELGVRG